jgi:hypothetical protein
VKSRPAPAAPSYNFAVERLLKQREVQNWLQARKSDPDAPPHGISPGTLAVVCRHLFAAEAGEKTTGFYEKAMRATTPLLSVPQMDDPVNDLRLAFGLPQMQQLWTEWNAPRTKGTRGPAADFESAKATLTVLAMTGMSAHVDDAYQRLRDSEDLRVMFASLGRIAQQRAVPSLPGLGAKPAALNLRAYNTVTTHFPRIAVVGSTAAVAARIAMLRELRDLVPGGQRIGQTLMIDGSDCPAWVRQKGAARGSDYDNELRGRCPQAGYRMYKRNSQGTKVDVEAGDDARSLMASAKIKDWRGYYLMAIGDQATGLPLITLLVDASINEYDAVPMLLDQLYRVWPDCPAERIVGDSNFDIDWLCELCERGYGLHPIFRARNNSAYKHVSTQWTRDGSIDAVTKDGQLICATHNKPMGFKSMVTAKRTSTDADGNEVALPAGSETDAGDFRVHCTCPEGHNASFKAAFDWRRLTFYPHYRAGRPERYAERHAYLDRLSGQESFFNRIKTAYKLATRGTDRTRITDMATVGAMIDLACTNMVALALVDQRHRHGRELHLAVPPSKAPRADDDLAHRVAA